MPAPLDMLNAMRVPAILVFLPVLIAASFGQAVSKTPEFDVASVRLSEHAVGPDYNNQITYSPSGFTARNITLKRLIAEAYRLQLNQISGPSWLDRNEYDVEAKTTAASGREQMAPMLQSLLAERFNLREHSEMREMRAYALVVGKGGPRVTPANPAETGSAQGGFHFHGDMREFADLLAVQFSIPAPTNPNEPSRAGGPPIPVLNETGLEGIYDFSVDMRPELGTDIFTLWQRTLQDQLGLRIESRKGSVPVLVVDDAARNPTEN
jgi:uncharacterized protein (TIGR03435 family)